MIVPSPAPDGAAGQTSIPGSGGTEAGSGDAELTELTIDVTESTEGVLSPAASVSVRIEGEGSTGEALTDERGHVTVSLPRASGPWDVTVARAGFVPISILDVD